MNASIMNRLVAAALLLGSTAAQAKGDPITMPLQEARALRKSAEQYKEMAGQYKRTFGYEERQLLHLLTAFALDADVEAALGPLAGGGAG